MLAPRPIAAAAIAALVLLGGGPSRAQSPPSSGGLDVVLLVDVSRSMYSADANTVVDRGQHRPNGSDPDRLRWDAVQLVLNLLTAEDRVLILPFNQEAPARDTQMGWPVPGNLDTELVPIREKREELLRKVESFIHSGGVPSPTTDAGGTSILGALAKAAELTKKRNPAPNRRLAVILLTDGSEDDASRARFPAFEDEGKFRDYLHPWSLQDGVRPETPVYTIALGSERAVEAGEIRLEYLERIANLTRGAPRWVKSNSEIIETFRDRIWQLKGCWIKPITMAEQASTEDTMLGIVDLGILGYEQRPPARLADGRPDPRNTRPLSVRPMPAWSGGRGRPPEFAHRGGKGGGGYDYWYVGRDSAVRSSPFAPIADRGLTLTTSWKPGDGQLSFAKRTEKPLLWIGSWPSGRLQRHAELVLFVKFDAENPHFKPEMFRLTATVTRNAGDPEGAGASRPFEFRPQADGFRCPIRLDGLPRGAGASDTYNVLIVAEGLAEPRHALSHYRVELPEHIIEVDNRLVLAALGRIGLSNTEKGRVCRVPLQTRARIEGELELSVRLAEVPRTKAGKPVPPERLRVRQADGDGAAEGVVRLRDGRAELEVAFVDDPEHPLEQGSYQDGRIVLTADPSVGLEPVTIPLDLRVDVVKLTTRPKRLTLESRPEGHLSELPIVIGTADTEGPTLGSVPCRVTLRRKGDDAAKFDEKELWIEAEDASGRAVRGQEVEIGPGQGFRIGFRPRPDSKKEGKTHEYSWIVEAPGADPATGELVLDYKAPKLEGPAGGRTMVRLGRGAELEVPIEVAIRGQEGVRRSVVFRPDPDRVRGGRVVFTRVGAPAGEAETTDIELSADDSKPVEVVATGAGQVPAAAVQVHLRVPETTPGGVPLPDGHYEAVGSLVAVEGGAIESPVVLDVVLNSLQVLAIEPGAGPGWVPCERIDLYPFFDAELTKTFRIRTGLDDPLSPDAVDVVPENLTSYSGDIITQVPEKLGVRAIEGGRMLELTFRFPPVATALSEPYDMKAVFQYPELNLEARLPIHVTFLDVRPDPPAEREPR